MTSPAHENDPLPEIQAGEPPAAETPAAGHGPAAQAAPERPVYVPEKFWDPQGHCVRVEALAKSYGELERKLGARAAGAVASEAPAAGPATALIAVAPEAPCPAPVPYQINAPHPALVQDPQLDERLQAAGFSEQQAQLVYDLAAELLLPLIGDVLGEIEARRQVDRLERQFGGADSWSQTARQLKGWADAHLTPEVAATLAGSFEGVLALHQMMRASEPELLAGAEEPAAELSEDSLVQMMRDPRYWRRRDPDFIARVTAGFKKLYQA